MKHRWLMAALSLLLASAWLYFAKNLWVFTQDTFLVPVEGQAFSFLFHFFSGDRVVLSSWLIHPLLVISSLLPMILWLLLLPVTIRLSASLPIAFRWLLSFAVLYFTLPYAVPGQSSEVIFYLLALGLSAMLLIQEPRAIRTWVLVNILLLISLAFEVHRVVLLWTLFSFGTSYSFSFLFSSRLRIPLSKRRRMLEQLLFSLALLATASAVVGMIHLAGFELKPSSRWWLSWIVFVPCLGLTLWRPMEFSRWLRFVFFSCGLFVSSNLEPLTFVLLAWLAIEVSSQAIKNYGQAWSAKVSAPSAYRTATVSIFVVGALTAIAIRMHTLNPQRNFQVPWVSATKTLMKENPTGNYLVVGRGLPFMSYFLKGELMASDQILTEVNEGDLVRELTEAGVTDIIIEKKHALLFWKNWIAKGQNPDIANESVLMRMLTYGGKGVETKTIRLGALKSLTKKPLLEDEEVVWFNINPAVKP